MKQYSVSDQIHGPRLPSIRASVAGGACFALTGLMVTAVLMGKNVPQSSIAAYFVNSNVVTVGRHSLDLSRPIFVRGDVPICPSEDALAAYAADDPQGCTVLSASSPAGLIGIVTDGMREPTFQMQMNTSAGTVRGWVDYNNLTN